MNGLGKPCIIKASPMTLHPTASVGSDSLDGLGNFVVDPTRVNEEVMPSRCGLRTAANAFDQSHAKLLFQQADV